MSALDDLGYMLPVIETADDLIAAHQALAADPSVQWYLQEREAALIAAGAWDPKLHPRGHDGKFINVFAWVKFLTGDGSMAKWQRGQVESISDDGVTVGWDDWNGSHTSQYHATKLIKNPTKSIYTLPTPKATLHLPDVNKGTDDAGFKKVGGQGGSNPGGMYLAENTADVVGGKVEVSSLPTVDPTKFTPAITGPVHLVDSPSGTHAFEITKDQGGDLPSVVKSLLTNDRTQDPVQEVPPDVLGTWADDLAGAIAVGAGLDSSPSWNTSSTVDDHGYTNVTVDIKLKSGGTNEGEVDFTLSLGIQDGKPIAWYSGSPFSSGSQLTTDDREKLMVVIDQAIPSTVTAAGFEWQSEMNGPDYPDVHGLETDRPVVKDLVTGQAVHTSALAGQPTIKAKLDAAAQEAIDAAKNQSGDKPEPGSKFYIKKNASEERAHNEMLTNQLYRMAGVNVPDTYLGDDGLTFASKIDDPTEHEVHSLQSATDEEKNRMRDDFVVHAWLANWDAVGLGYDNTIIVDGSPQLIDAGGGLLYRAQGSPKGSMFGGKVGELDSLRSDLNPQAKDIFGPATMDQELDGARRVRDITPSDIQKAVEDNNLPSSLADTIIARRQYILDHYSLATGFDPELEHLLAEEEAIEKNVEAHEEAPKEEALPPGVVWKSIDRVKVGDRIYSATNGFTDSRIGGHNALDNHPSPNATVTQVGEPDAVGDVQAWFKWDNGDGTDYHWLFNGNEYLIDTSEVDASAAATMAPTPASHGGIPTHVGKGDEVKVGDLMEIHPHGDVGNLAGGSSFANSVVTGVASDGLIFYHPIPPATLDDVADPYHQVDKTSFASDYPEHIGDGVMYLFADQEYHYARPDGGAAVEPPPPHPTGGVVGWKKGAEIKVGDRVIAAPNGAYLKTPSEGDLPNATIETLDGPDSSGDIFGYWTTDDGQSGSDWFFHNLDYMVSTVTPPPSSASYEEKFNKAVADSFQDPVLTPEQVKKGLVAMKAGDDKSSFADAIGVDVYDVSHELDEFDNAMGTDDLGNWNETAATILDGLGATTTEPTEPTSVEPSYRQKFADAVNANFSQWDISPAKMQQAMEDVKNDDSAIGSSGIAEKLGIVGDVFESGPGGGLSFADSMGQFDSDMGTSSETSWSATFNTILDNLGPSTLTNEQVGEIIKPPETSTDYGPSPLGTVYNIASADTHKTVDKIVVGDAIHIEGSGGSAINSPNGPDAIVVGVDKGAHLDLQTIPGTEAYDTYPTGQGTDKSSLQWFFSPSDAWPVWTPKNGDPVIGGEMMHAPQVVTFPGDTGGNLSGNGKIIADGVTVGVYSSEWGPNSDVHLMLDQNYVNGSGYGSSGTWISGSASDAAQWVQEHALVPSIPAKDKPPEHETIEKAVVAPPVIPIGESLVGTKMADGGTPQVGLVVQHITSGKVGTIHHLADQEKYPGSVWVQYAGETKPILNSAKKLKDPASSEGTLKDTNGKDLHIGQIVTAGKAGEKGSIISVSPAAGSVKVYMPSGKKLWKKVSTVTILGEPEDGNTSAAQLTSEVTEIVPVVNYDEPEIPEIPLQSQASKDSWTELDRKLMLDGNRPYVGMPVVDKKGNKYIIVDWGHGSTNQNQMKLLDPVNSTQYSASFINRAVSTLSVDLEHPSFKAPTAGIVYVQPKFKKYHNRPGGKSYYSLESGDPYKSGLLDGDMLYRTTSDSSPGMSNYWIVTPAGEVKTASTSQFYAEYTSNQGESVAKFFSSTPDYQHIELVARGSSGSGNAVAVVQSQSYGSEMSPVAPPMLMKISDLEEGVPPEVLMAKVKTAKPLAEGNVPNASQVNVKTLSTPPTPKPVSVPTPTPTPAPASEPEIIAPPPPPIEVVQPVAGNVTNLDPLLVEPSEPPVFLTPSGYIQPPPKPLELVGEKPAGPPKIDLPEITGTSGDFSTPPPVPKAHSVFAAAQYVAEHKDDKTPGAGVGFSITDGGKIEDQAIRFQPVIDSTGKEFLEARVRMTMPAADAIGQKILVQGEISGELGAWVQDDMNVKDLTDGDLIAVVPGHSFGVYGEDVNVLKPTTADKPNVSVVGTPTFMGSPTGPKGTAKHDVWRVSVLDSQGNLAQVDIEDRGTKGDFPKYHFDWTIAQVTHTVDVSVHPQAADQGWVRTGNIGNTQSKGKPDPTGKKVYTAPFNSGPSTSGTNSAGSTLVREFDDGTSVAFSYALPSENYKYSHGSNSGTPRDGNFTNVAYIRVPMENATDRQELGRRLTQGLESLGITTDDLAPPTEAQMRHLAINKVAQLSAEPWHPGVTTDATGYDGDGNTDTVLKELKNQIGMPRDITMDDVTLYTEPDGRVWVGFSDEVADQMSKHQNSGQGVTYFRHSINGNGSEDVLQILSGPHSGLLSSDERWSRGILNSDGLSASGDLANGAGDRLYLTAMSGHLQGTGGWSMIYSARSVDRTTEVYEGTSSDNWGTHGAAWAKLTAGKEVMYKRTLPPDMLAYVFAPSEYDREQMIERLHEMGITEYGGRPIEDVIITSGSGIDVNSEEFKNLGTQTLGSTPITEVDSSGVVAA